LTSPTVIAEIRIVVGAFGAAYRFAALAALPQITVTVIMVGALTSDNAFWSDPVIAHFLTPLIQ
jgi:hypothetical protein